MNEPVERRKRERFLVQGGTFAFLHTSHGNLCQILDVSGEGLAFRYTRGLRGVEEASQLDVLLAEGPMYFYLGNVPFNVVSDVEWGYETINDSPLGFFALRRRGIRFGSLTDNQRGQLDFFLDNYTVKDHLKDRMSELIGRPQGNRILWRTE
jgi:hypothetical protein